MHRRKVVRAKRGGGEANQQPTLQSRVKQAFGRETIDNV